MISSILVITQLLRYDIVVQSSLGEKYMLKKLVGAIALIALTSCFSSSNAADEKSKNFDDKSKVTTIYDHLLPNVPGKSIKGVLVEYQPGGFSSAHTHPKSAFIYATVLEGAIRSQVNNGPVKTYKAGESFSEMPGDRHSVSENASKTKPARLLAVFVVDSNEKQLTTVCK